MSDLASAAAALGIPEPLAKRAAEARAAEHGVPVEEVYASWSGGASLPAASTPATEAAPEPTVDESVEASAAPSPAPVPPPTGGPTELPIAVSPVPAGPYKPPVLVGAVDNPVRLLVGVVGLFLVILLVGLVGPSMPVDIPGARTGEIAFSEQALEGQTIYLQMGCAACHTQMVRPVVADVGIGPVTLNDTNQILGSRRYGPDLANIGARSTPADIEGMVRGGSGHPGHNLSSDDMSALVAYLSESRPVGQ